MRKASKSHHYVPRFLLSRWGRASDGRVQVFRRKADGELFDAWCLPKEVGAQNHMWSLRGAEYDSSAIETEFFSHIDREASRILRDIEQKMGQMTSASLEFNWLSSDDLQFWAVFVVSLLVRSPLALNRLKVDFPNEVRAHLADLDEGRYDPERDPHLKEHHEVAKKLMPGSDSCRRILKQVEGQFPDWFQDNVLLQIISMTLDADLHGRILNMQWFTRKLVNTDLRFLISDRFMTRILSTADPRCTLAFPISPEYAFIATGHPSLFRYFMNITDKQLAMHLNINVASLAQSFVAGNCVRTFLDKWFLCSVEGTGH